MLARDRGATAPGCDSRREAVTVMVVWIAVGRFAGMLGLASVTDYLRARTGKRSVLHRSPRHRHRSRGDQLRETLRAADDLEQATIESLTSNPPPAAGHLCAGACIRHRHLAGRLGGLDACGPLGKRGPGRDDSMTLVSWLGGIFSGIDVADLRDLATDSILDINDGITSAAGIAEGF